MTKGALFTIGYEGRTQDAYLALLREAGVTLLADVRRNPISRKKGFSKKALAEACAAAGIRYEHLPELGIASEKRKGLKTRAEYDALFAEYERAWLPLQGEALGKVRGWMDAGERVALMCFERRASSASAGTSGSSLQSAIMCSSATRRSTTGQCQYRCSRASRVT